MSIEIRELSAREVGVALATEEGHFADMKAIEVAPAKLTRSMSAFSNADGGELLIGIDETAQGKSKKRSWRGFSSPEDANGHLKRTSTGVRERVPLKQFAHYEFLRDSDHPNRGVALRASIQRTPEIRSATDGKVYVRRGTQNLPVVTPDSIRRLEYAKGVRSFEMQTIDVPLEIVTNSEAIIGFMLEVVPTAEPDQWLRKQLLVRGDMPTVAAVVLFADEPSLRYPSSRRSRSIATEPLRSVGAERT